MKINLAVLVLLGILFHSVAGASVEDLYTSTFEGDLTYYGPTSGGNCGIVPRPSWYDDLTFSAALNANQYASDDKCAGCGVCIRGNYLNTGAGTTPPPSTFSIFIIDQCPECSKGDIDINNESGQSVDGRWQIEWQAIDCPVGSGKLQYLFQGSNSWYMKIGVRNHRIAITKLEIQPFNSAFVTPDRTTDNFFEYNTPNSSTFSFPMKVRVTGVNGQVIEDVVPKLVEGDNSELVSGTNSVQFNAYKPDGGSTGSTTKATATTTKASATTTKASATTTKNSGGDGGDDGSDGSGGCFAASSVVRVMDPAGLVISKTLEEVRAGDLVESVDGQLRRVFSPVYYMAHGSDSRPVRLVEIVTAASSSLKLTPNHLVFLADNLLQQPRLQHARHAREGQFLFALTADDDDNDEQLQEQQAQPVRIVAVKEAWESVRNPLTDNERIVVSGVACSVFVESASVYSTLTTPVKAFARAFPSLFQEHSWVSLLLDHIVRFTDSVETAVAAWTRPSSII